MRSKAIAMCLGQVHLNGVGGAVGASFQAVTISVQSCLGFERRTHPSQKHPSGVPLQHAPARRLPVP